jgi:protein ImuB
LGAENVLLPRLHADHRPECMQSWVPARTCGGSKDQAGQLPVDALYPAWLLPQPQRLEVRGDKPHYRGPLRLLAGPQRLETGWWDPGLPGPAMRDYFIAASEQAGLLWVYRERLVHGGGAEDFAPVRWYLHGVYA